MSKAYNEDLVLNNMSVFVGVESLGSITKPTHLSLNIINTSSIKPGSPPLIILSMVRTFISNAGANFINITIR